jgi:hypothetical protein
MQITCQPTLIRTPEIRCPYREHTRAPATFVFARFHTPSATLYIVAACYSLLTIAVKLFVTFLCHVVI